MTSNSEKSRNGAGAIRWLSWLRRRLSRRHVLFGVLALFAFDALFYAFAVHPLAAREEEQRVFVTTLRGQIDRKSKEIETLKMVVGRIEAARVEGETLMQDILMVRRTTYYRLIAELIEAANEAGIEARERNYDIDVIADAEEYGAITVTAYFRGEYDKLVKLLNRLDRSERFLIIGALGAVPRSDTNELQINLKIDTFIQGL